MNDLKQQTLQEHLDKEDNARAQSDMRAILRMSYEFHVLLADLAGNFALVRSMRELSKLTGLIISLYDAPMVTSCRSDEHKSIVAAINTKFPKVSYQYLNLKLFNTALHKNSI